MDPTLPKNVHDYFTAKCLSEDWPLLPVNVGLIMASKNISLTAVKATMVK
jgi:hypothetical protein